MAFQCIKYNLDEILKDAHAQKDHFNKDDNHHNNAILYGDIEIF